MAATLLLIATSPLIRASTNAPADTNSIPPLRPAKAHLPPGFWEEHGVWVVVPTVFVLVVAVVLLRIWLRPKPPVLLDPSVVARQALSALDEGKPHGSLLSDVSLVLRRYFTDAFQLPSQQFTDRELCQALREHPAVDKPLIDSSTAFFQEMERNRFNDETGILLTEAIQSARALIDQAEHRLKPTAPEPVAGGVSG